MTSNLIATIITVTVQAATTSIIAWLAHKLGAARTEFRTFMKEHEYLLASAKENSDAIIKLNSRLDRIASRRG